MHLSGEVTLDDCSPSHTIYFFLLYLLLVLVSKDWYV